MTNDDDIRELARTVTADQAWAAVERSRRRYKTAAQDGRDYHVARLVHQLAIRLYGAVRARDEHPLCQTCNAARVRHGAVAIEQEIAALLADDGLRELLTEATAPSIS